MNSSQSEKFNLNHDIAVVGMTGLFPGANSVEEFWKNILAGKESISFFSPEELAAAGVSQKRMVDGRFVAARGRIGGVQDFDAGFFGYAPREAEVMDPQQRLFLEQSWKALELAGYDPESYPGRIGVFGSIGHNAYFTNYVSRTKRDKLASLMEIAVANDKDHLATRVAYKLNLRGPALTIQSTCSSSLSAICIAMQNILSDECDMALAGGVSISVPEVRGYIFHPGGILSPDGRCRPFDAAGQGTVFSNGLGTVVLKKLSAAMADGDTIHAVVKGAALNNDGSRKIGYTAPSYLGQADVIERAQARAGVRACEIGYVEAHGTATKLGDPIEISALRKAFDSQGAGGKAGHCALGAVKSNLGHLNSAAGVVGFIKAALVVREGLIPPHPNFETLNQAIELEGSPFFISKEKSAWAESLPHRYAGVSSFGIGGTNAHIVLSEPPPRVVAPALPRREWSVFPMSAASLPALHEAVSAMRRHLAEWPQAIDSVAHTLQSGRKHFGRRFAVAYREKADVMASLDRRLDDVELPLDEVADGTVFMFPGQGSVRLGATKALYDQEPTFQQALDRCAALFSKQFDLDFDIRKELHAQEAGNGNGNLDETLVCQPVIFSVSYALAQLWLSWGIQPTAMLGHSVGEYVAAVLAGVFELEDAVQILASRAKLMHKLPRGGMMSVSMAAHAADVLIQESGLPLDVAVVNGPEVCVLSGDKAVLQEFAGHLAERGIEGQMLRVSHSFHSRAMRPIVPALLQAFSGIRLQAPKIPFLSNVTGDWMTEKDATNPEYWTDHLVRAVQFDAALTRLLDRPATLLLEVGAGQVLSGLLRSRQDTRLHVIVSSMPHARSQDGESRTLASALGRLWQAGARVDWAAYAFQRQEQRVPLPTYPFQRSAYWVEAGAGTSMPEGPGAAVDERKPRALASAPLDSLFHNVVWKQSQGMSSGSRLKNWLAEPRRWLLLADAHGVGTALREELSAHGHDVILVERRPGFEKLGSGGYAASGQASSDDFARVIEDLKQEERLPNQVVNLWGVSPSQDRDTLMASVYWSSIQIVRALERVKSTRPLHLTSVLSGLHPLSDADAIEPLKSLATGPANALPREHGNVACRTIDIAIPRSPAALRESVLGILAEIAVWPAETTCALRRHGRRWIRTIEPIGLPPVPSELAKTEEVYLLTGGTDGIGLSLAEHLCRTRGARVALLDQRALPEKAAWRSVIEAGGDATLVDLLGRLLRLEQQGGGLEVFSGDVADEAFTRQVVEQVFAAWGRLDGVVHAAEVAGSGPAATASVEKTEAVFKPKVDGAGALLRALRGRPVGWLALCSSSVALRGDQGDADDVGANAFLDTLASTADEEFPVVSIDWPTWAEIGSAVKDSSGAGGGISLDKSFSVSQAIAAFDRILASGCRNVVVSPSALALNTTAAIKEARVVRHPVPADGAPAVKQRKKHPRPALDSTYVAPSNPIEEKVHALWSDLLGIESIGVQDNFFSLGGHSLMAVRLTSRIRESFQLNFDLEDFFVRQTIEEASELLLFRSAEHLDDDALSTLLEELEAASPAANSRGPCP
ncbi:MAG: SDR family NAD(P)-dependent oxidoreductase [Burkholderiaceae bacterium]